MVSDKVSLSFIFYSLFILIYFIQMHSRSQGLVTSLTMQPLEGRSRDGGKLLMPQWYVKILLVCRNRQYVQIQGKTN